LFSNDPERDLGYLEAALAGGRLSRERVDEAVIRQLGLKAAVGLHRPQTADSSVLALAASRAYAEAVTRRIPTLVKDTQNLLPLEPARHRRVLVATAGIIEPWRPEPIPFALPGMLAERGFDVTMYQPGMAPNPAEFDLL